METFSEKNSRFFVEKQYSPGYDTGTFQIYKEYLFMMSSIDLLMELIRFRPVSSDLNAVNKVQRRVKEILEREGLFCTMEHLPSRHEILFASTAPGKTPDILLNAHLDVVPADDESQFKPEIRSDGFLYGRGANDCLGSAVCIAEILCRSKNASNSVGAIFTGDEEIGGSTTLAMVERGYAAKKIVMILDGNIDDGIVIGHKGMMVLKLIAHGKSGHSSIPWCLDNPIDKLVRGYSALLAVWKNPSPGHSWANSMAACMIHSGTAKNQIPETAEMYLNFRFIADDDADRIESFVREKTGLTVERCPDSSCVVDSSPDADAVKKLHAVLSAHFPEKTIGFHKMHGATDARHFKKLNLPIVILGPQGGNVHSLDEFVIPESIRKYSDILTEYANSLK